MAAHVTLHPLQPADGLAISAWFASQEADHRVGSWRPGDCSKVMPVGAGRCMEWAGRNHLGECVVYLAAASVPPIADEFIAGGIQSVEGRDAVAIKYLVPQHLQGLGYATAALRAAATVLTWHDTDLFCHIASDHSASQAVAVAAGFEFVGATRYRARKNHPRYMWHYRLQR
ncbi:GNAT family N-acetyltransferase [Nocardia sp. XZ_19_369]|uniref:GNAT family N-acetyltransferase n=1 Tax=Nocardia sp. XZ_19_369 TaxID=2769487 RepID=UPI00189027B8|nr:GNAT family N-acetyltransferase [Nocardia sp. XZ_19_369]